MKKKFKITLSFLMIISIVSGLKTNTYAATDPDNAPTDWAFTENSIPLHDAILDAYPTVDTSGDGYISISEANSMTGRLELRNLELQESTLDGITNFTGIYYLYLRNCGIKGEIPNNIDDMVGLQYLYLSLNNLSGTIPNSVTSMTRLIQFSIASNKITGTIPENIGNLTEVTVLDFNNNAMSGSIPQSIGSLTKLKRVNFADNNFSGVVPEEVYSLPVLERFIISNNSDLRGNLAEGFASSTTLNYLDVSGTAAIQAAPDIPSLNEFYYDNLSEELLNDTKTNLTNGVTQDTIDKAQESANYWAEPDKSAWQTNIDLAQSMLNTKNEVDSLFNEDKSDLASGITQGDIDDTQNMVTVLPDGELKTELQNQIDKAQDLLNAKEAVDNLFNNDKTDLGNGVDQTDIDNAQDLVTTLPDGEVKDALQKEIDKAQDMLNAKEAVEDLFDDNGNIKDTVTQENINNAQDLVNKLPNGSLKDELQAMIDEAQKQLDAKNKPLTPTKAPDVVSTDTTKTISTGDITTVTTYLGLLSISIVILGYISK
ncbi:MAG: toxin Cry1Ac domain D-VI-related protein [Coprobacillaceae bacterium]